MGGGDFTWLASGQILKVGGNTRLQVELCNRSDLHTLRPGRAPDFPRARSAGWASSSRPAPRDGGPAERCGASRSCDSALGWGHGSFPLLSLVWGAARRGAEAQTRSGGRGASTVQDAHRRRAEVMRLVVGPGAGPLAQEAGRPHFESKLLRRVPKVAEHDVHYGHLLHPRCVDLQHRLLVALPHLRAGEVGGVGGLPGHAPLVVPVWSPSAVPGLCNRPFCGEQERNFPGPVGVGVGESWGPGPQSPAPERRLPPSPTLAQHRLSSPDRACWPCQCRTRSSHEGKVHVPHTPWGACTWGRTQRAPWPFVHVQAAACLGRPGPGTVGSSAQDVRTQETADTAPAESGIQGCRLAPGPAP